MNPIRIGPTACGRGCPVFLAFECGPTITSCKAAHRLLEAVVAAGADGFKVQILDPDQLVGRDVLVDYRLWDGTPCRESMREILERRVLGREQWMELGQMTRAAGLAFIATVDVPTTLAVALEAGATALKVCSGDIDHVDWIAEVARTGVPVMLDTGHATLGELERAVEACLRAGNDRLVLHHVPGGYPARLDSIHLRIIPTLRQVFGEFVTAFSDHSAGWDMDVAAVALGAEMIEKTLTLDRTQKSPEHGMSVEVGEARAFVQAIRDVERALGRSRRMLTEEERTKKTGARRSAFALRDLPAGTILTDDLIGWRRPGTGLTPQMPVRGRRLLRAVRAGAMLTPEDLT